jgi:hypothetical protein
MSPLDAAALARPAPRSAAPGASRPATGRSAAASRPAASSNGAARKLDTDDLFGMDELTGDAPAAKARPAPPASRTAAKVAPKAMPNFDDIDIHVGDDGAQASPPPPQKPSKTPAPAVAEVKVRTAPPDLKPAALATPPQPPDVAEGEESIKLGAFKTQLKDPFEGMEMGAEGTGALELATQPKRDKLMEAAARADAEKPRREPEPPPAAKPPEPELPPGRAMVSSALTGLLGAALAVAVVIASALSDEAAAGWLGLGHSSDIVATRVVSGLYDTAGGKPVFYVRGHIENRSQKVRGPVRVTAELIADGAPEGRAEALAGAEPTPEDVWALKSPADADKLNKTLEQSHVERKLSPGGSLPFFAVIADPPQDLQNHRLRVKVEPMDAWVPPAPGKGKK